MQILVKVKLATVNNTTNATPLKAIIKTIADKADTATTIDELTTFALHDVNAITATVNPFETFEIG
jgi:hypothetical protein